MEREQVRKYNPRGLSEHNVVDTYPAFWSPWPARTSRHEMHDFQLCKDDKGVEFVQFTEGQTKTRQGGLHTKLRDFQPRMFAVGGERCPVALFKQFVSRRPQTLKTTSPFYLSIKTNRKPDDNVWFKVQPMGKNKINNMMKSIVADSILESSDKKFTNHSARKTVVSKLKKANVERSGIVKVTGHKNIQSLDDYDEANKDEQRQLSYAISGRNNFDPQPTVSRETPGIQQEPLASSAQFLQPPRARMPLQPMSISAQSISVWTKPKFHIAQSNNDESSRAKSVEHFQLLPGFRLNFRIPGHDCVTLNACSHSPAVNKYLYMETKEKYLRSVLPQSRCRPQIKNFSHILISVIYL